MKKLLLLVLLLPFIPANTFAQSTFSLQATGMMPTGEFARDLPDRLGGGLSIEYVQKITPKIYVGARYGYMTLGRDRQEWALAEPLGTRDVTWHHTMGNFLGFARFKPVTQGLIRPYVDFVIGSTWINSETYYILTEAEGAIPHDEEECPDNSRTLERMNGVTTTYGIGGGYAIHTFKCS